MANEVEEIERIFQDITNHSKNVKHLEICNNVVNHELQLQKHKNHLAKLKTMLIRLQTQSRFVEMAKENWSSASDIEMTEHQANARKESKKVKQTIEELETQTDELSETLCTKHKVLKEKLELLENRLISTKDKRKNFEMLKNKLEKMADKDQQKENSQDSFEEVKAKQVEADLAIQQCTAAISGLEHCIGLVQVEMSRVEGFFRELEEELKIQTELKNDCNEKEQKNQQWLAGAVELYSHLGGVSVQSVQGDCVVLEISDAHPGHQGSGAPGQANTPLILTIKFRLVGGTRPVFAGATVSLDSLNIDDLVSEAVDSSDVVGFVLQVKQRFTNQRSLIREVEELQTNYAMDWEPSHDRIRVMLGRSGKIVCTLKVDTMYSSGQGHVQLLRVEGNSDQTGIQHLQSTGPGRNLSQWIKDLQELFSSQ